MGTKITSSSKAPKKKLLNDEAFVEGGGSVPASGESGSTTTSTGYQALLDQIEATRNSQYEAADKSKGAAVDAANAEYERAKSTYGSTAEALARNGLTGSGYSDYLTGKAYSERAANIRAADQAYQNAIRSADTAADSSIATVRSKKSEYLDAIIGKVNSGELDAGLARDQAANMGLTEDELGKIDAAGSRYNGWIEKTQYEEMNTIASSQGIAAAYEYAKANGLDTNNSESFNLNTYAEKYQPRTHDDPGSNTPKVRRVNHNYVTVEGVGNFNVATSDTAETDKGVLNAAYFVQEGQVFMYKSELGEAKLYVKMDGNVYQITRHKSDMFDAYGKLLRGFLSDNGDFQR